MDAEQLHYQLRQRGLTALAVIPHHRRRDVLNVYLHGNDGQWSGGAAVRLIRSIPGVVEATASLCVPSIVLVRCEAGPPCADAGEGPAVASSPDGPAAAAEASSSSLPQPPISGGGRVLYLA